MARPESCSALMAAKRVAVSGAVLVKPESCGDITHQIHGDVASLARTGKLISAVCMQVAMQMGQGGGYPGGPPPPNFFNLPPGGGMYPSMDPSQSGTRAQRQDGSEAGIWAFLSCTKC